MSSCLFFNCLTPQSSLNFSKLLLLRRFLPSISRKEQCLDSPTRQAELHIQNAPLCRTAIESSSRSPRSRYYRLLANDGFLDLLVEYFSKLCTRTGNVSKFTIWCETLPETFRCSLACIGCPCMLPVFVHPTLESYR